MKHIAYEKLNSYDTKILYRMRNCLKYLNSLDDDTFITLCDILYDRWCEMCL